MASLSDTALAALLDRLDSEEHLVSTQRRRLHDGIDSPIAWSGDTPESARQSLSESRPQERLLSERRLQPHRQINEVRIERRRRIGRSHLSLVE